METQNEQILIEALGLRDDGKSLEEILRAYPGAEKEIRELFKSIALLEDAKKGILPRKEVLQYTLDQMKVSPVINRTDIRYSHKNERDEIKGRVSSINLQDQIRGIFVTLNARILIPTAIIAVLAIAFVYYQYGSRAPEYAYEGNPPTTVVPSTTGGAPLALEGYTAPITPSTGDPDEAVNDLLQFSADEQIALAAETNTDASDFTADSQDLGDLGQSYDETQF
ncbi:MAG: hypothetical protein HYT40_01955 [Candidatus Sungbacteria bacterium]|uniref:Uncharacterized protein n=1 Tax=Candidatus Sungiibacteriota bacterium TaxID=2750080 RepID=A0A931SDW1_9BACT|nr:hypothetical protein [Candidatus Sungbacteria bacterium]